MRFRFKNLDKYIRQLENISNPYAVDAYVRKAIENGAQIVNQASLSALSSLPVDNRPYVKEGRTSIMQVQKDALLGSFGVSPIEDRNGFVNVKTGVARGKNKLGQAHVTIARRLESGTSYMPKRPVISRASRKSRKPCIEEMQRTLTQEIRRLMR